MFITLVNNRSISTCGCGCYEEDYEEFETILSTQKKSVNLHDLYHQYQEHCSHTHITIRLMQDPKNLNRQGKLKQTVLKQHINKDEKYMRFAEYLVKYHKFKKVDFKKHAYYNQYDN